MKKTRTKLLSLLVVLCMVLTLLPMAALAADAQFTDMPNDYSTAALQAAVTNGLLKGSGGQLRPAASLTRAEMATILNHAFGAAEKSDISGYADVPAGAWYANEMAVAVHMKTLVGSGKMLNPNAPVTREEALTALASVLKLPAGSDTALAKYKDSAKVASWAKGSVAAMAAAGYASGDGANLNRTANITRADFAVIMNSIVKTYITKAGTYTDNLTSSVMVNVPGVVLKNITITGDLIIGDGVGSGDITLDGVTVTGRTVVRGGGVHSVKIINKSNVGTLTISKVDGEIRVAADASSSVEVVVINDGKDDVIVEGNVDKLEVAAGVPVTVQGGTVGEVSVTAPHASVTVAASATVTTLTATGAQPSLTVQGTVTTLTADKTATGASVNVEKGAKVGTVNAAAEGAAVTGEGTVTNANVTGNNVNVATSGTSVTVAK
ncbi:MAG TPA: S-layer homology domain-containing protein, partial [Oscillospiraceae bacterium]|nr:S-layer homology domain-containing protein [Oscillospiraceae bacterium]